MKADYHVHTEFSDDSEYQMEQVVRDSIVMGLDEICFTDHVDYGVKNDWDDGEKIRYREGIPGEPENMPILNVNYPLYYKTYQKMKTQYGDKITLKLGMEFGMQVHTIEQYEKLYAKYPFEKIKPIFTEILKTVIADGKGIEVNTSSHRYGLSNLTPSRDILKLYRELGGTIITIGSDSHKPEHLGTFIDETKQELKTLGFKEFCTFDKMKPIYHQL